MFISCDVWGDNTKTVNDIFTRQGVTKKALKEKADLLKSQKTFRRETTSGKQIRAIPSTSSQKDKKTEHLSLLNGIGLYIGNCPFTKDAVNKIKRFLGKYKDVETQYFIVKTNSDYQLDSAAIEGLEISLPVDADMFDISEIPAFVLNINNVMYKATGSDVSLEEIIESVNKNSVKGEKRKNYTDIGVFGKTCKTQKMDLTPRELTRDDIAVVIKDALRQPVIKIDTKNLSSVLPTTEKPVVKDKNIDTNYSGIKTIVIYSSKQSAWAQDVINKNAAIGCCTDCSDSPDSKLDNSQICSKDVLEHLGVSTVPTIINIKEKQ